jgi:GTP 3',8-cyclase
MNVDTLRISVTAECNLRCVYCRPRGDDETACGTEVLTLEEICRVVRLAGQCGIRKIRLTGGEPLLRQDIVALVERIAAVRGIDEVAMTTNGVLLAQAAQRLKDAGLDRVNISLNAAVGPCYRRMTGYDLLGPAMESIHEAIRVGLSPVRLNCVVMRDDNLAEVPGLARLSLHLPISVRFIEYCPTSRLSPAASNTVPSQEVRGLIESRFGPLGPTVPEKANGPAVYFRLEDAVGTIGFISGASSNFCHRCNRLRLASDGRIRPCLYASQSYDLRPLLRGPSTDEAILRLLCRILRDKHDYTRLTASGEDFSMRRIGG